MDLRAGEGGYAHGHERIVKGQADDRRQQIKCNCVYTYYLPHQAQLLVAPALSFVEFVQNFQLTWAIC